jgi:hypothetical protein
MTFKKIFLLTCIASFIQSSSQQAQAITEQQANIVSYGIGGVAGAATGFIVFRLLEQNDAQQQKETQEPVIVENDNSNLITIDNAENKDNSHHIRNLIIGAACGVVVGVLAYKISDNILVPHLVDQETHFCEIKLFIRDSKGGKLHEVPVPDNFMLDSSTESFRNFLNWIKETYKDSYEYHYQKNDMEKIKNMFESFRFESRLSGGDILNPNVSEEKPSLTETPQGTEIKK